MTMAIVNYYAVVFLVREGPLGKEKTPEFTQKWAKKIHELFVLALALVWFAGATPDLRVHAKGVVLCERACFCLLSTF